jgi:hypothetical protein
MCCRMVATIVVATRGRGACRGEYTAERVLSRQAGYMHRSHASARRFLAEESSTVLALARKASGACWVQAAWPGPMATCNSCQDFKRAV